MDADTDQWKQDVARHLDHMIERAVASAEELCALPLPDDKAGIAALKGSVGASFTLVESLLKLRDYTEPPSGSRDKLSPAETEDLLAGARRTLARTRPKDPG